MIHGTIENNKETITVQFIRKAGHLLKFSYREVKSIHAAKCLISRYIKSGKA
jgi:hypothetical protein